MNNYNHLITEKKWQKFFEENKVFKTNNKIYNKKDDNYANKIFGPQLY